MARSHVNAVVIGAGAAGGIVAKELAEAGLSVLLLERGRWHSPFEFRKDDLINQRPPWPLKAAFGPDAARNPRVAVTPEGEERLVSPRQGEYQNNAACVGGGTFSYGAQAWRFMAEDFRFKSKYGAVEGSTVEDWPISYDDLEPHYEKAEWEIGVSGDDDANPFKSPRRRPLPMPPLPPTREHELLKAAALRLGLHPFDIPMLRNSVPYGGRPPCMRCRWCVGFACEVDAKCGTHNTVIPTALATGHCALETDCMVERIQFDAQGRATGITYFDASDRRHEQSADLVIVSGGAIESARLLLNSTSPLHPQGLGNRHDWVGRNLQGHPYPGAFGLFDEVVFDDIGPGASIAICDFNHDNPGLVGGGMLANEFIRLPVQLFNSRPDDVPSWGLAHKQYMRHYFTRSLPIIGPVQGLPMFDCRVELDPRVRDHWGLPVARISGTKHPHTLEVSDAMSKQAERWLLEAGAIKTWRWGTGPSVAGSHHQAGTCRMGDDPKTSVVDRYCRVHDADNVFVIDGSVNVTNGGFNPVLTIMAIAYYASDYIRKEWKAGGLR